MYPPILRVHFQERSEEDFMRSILNDFYAILFLIFFIKAHVIRYSFELPRLVSVSLSDIVVS